MARSLLPLNASKPALESVLARHRVDSYPALYAGREDDAVFFVRHHYGPTRKQLLLTAQCFGLAETDW